MLDYVFFFKQKTAYEMRISDWSSDVCSSDLLRTIIRWLPPGEIPSTRPTIACCSIHIPLSIRKKGCRTCGSKAAKPVAVRSPVCRCEIGRASCRERVCQYV